MSAIFFALEISPGKPTQYTPPDGRTFRATQVTLGHKIVSDGRSCLSVKIGSEDYVLATLLPKKLEHTNLETLFEDGQPLEFSVTGQNSVVVAGNLVLNEDDEQEEIEEEAEEEGSESDEDAEAETQGGEPKKRPNQSPGGAFPPPLKQQKTTANPAQVESQSGCA